MAASHKSRRLIDQPHPPDRLRRREEKGEAFRGMPYEKIKEWAELPLRDKRVKPLTKKKVVKTFRLDPAAVERLRQAAETNGCTETEILETLLLQDASSFIQQ